MKLWNHCYWLILLMKIFILSSAAAFGYEPEAPLLGQIKLSAGCDQEAFQFQMLKVVAQEKNPLRSGRPASIVGTIDPTSGAFVIENRRQYRDYIVKLLKKMESKEVAYKDVRYYASRSPIILEVACEQ